MKEVIEKDVVNAENLIYEIDESGKVKIKH